MLLEQYRRAAEDIEPSLGVFVTAGSVNPFLAVAQDLGMSAFEISQKSSYDRRVGQAVQALVDRVQPDVIVAHDYKADLFGSRAAKRLGIPVVAVVHGFTRETFRVRCFEFLDRRRLKRFDAVVAVSDAMEERLRGCGVRDSRLHRIENTIDADSIAMSALAARAKTREKWLHHVDEAAIVTLGRLSPEKGHTDLLDALERIQHDRWRWIVVGDGAQEAVLRDRAKRAGLSHKIHFAGWVADGAAALGAADLFVMPSRAEGLPLALLEAMAVGLPIVATRVGGIPSALDEGACGRLVEPQDPSALATAIDSLLSDRDAAKALGDAAAKRVRTHYGADTQVQALEALYRELAAGG